MNIGVMMVLHQNGDWINILGKQLNELVDRIDYKLLGYLKFNIKKNITKKF